MPILAIFIHGFLIKKRQSRENIYIVKNRKAFYPTLNHNNDHLHYRHRNFPDDPGAYYSRSKAAAR